MKFYAVVNILGSGCTSRSQVTELSLLSLLSETRNFKISGYSQYTFAAKLMTSCSANVCNTLLKTG